ncbi:MAG: SMC-Scp complex subunit ScpB [Clostridiales bacterium]|nr:SMC-Scp complex subunit ScpB [Clostridiales bacterium]
MEYNERFGAIECILFVSGDPVPIIELQRAIGVTDIEMEHIIRSMEELYKKEKRGVQLFITPETMQLVSNKEYAKYVEELVQPVQAKSFSQAMLETLSVIAYRQPVTRADIEAVRGVRCEYAVSQLMKMGMIRELGRKNVVGRPMLLGTTDAFLRHFGIRSLNELPSLGSGENAEIAGAEEAVPADTDIETAEAEAGLPA